MNEIMSFESLIPFLGLMATLYMVFAGLDVPSKAINKLLGNEMHDRAENQYGNMGYLGNELFTKMTITDQDDCKKIDLIKEKIKEKGKLIDKMRKSPPNIRFLVDGSVFSVLFCSTLLLIISLKLPQNVVYPFILFFSISSLVYISINAIQNKENSSGAYIVRVIK